MGANGLVRLLRPFDIRPRDLRFGTEILKGYQRSDLDEAWTRYLPGYSYTPSSEGQQGRQDSVYEGASAFPEGQQPARVAANKTEKSPTNSRVVAAVAAMVSPPWEELGSATGGPRTDRTISVGRCFVHPSNAEEWWLRGSDLLCGICHPNPADLGP